MMNQDKLLEILIKHKLRLVLVLGIAVGFALSRVSVIDAFFDAYPNADFWILLPTGVFCLWLLSALKKKEREAS